MLSFNQLFAIGLGGQELWIIVILILILFGGKKIPELMRGVGKGVGELQKGMEEGKRSLDAARNYDYASEPDAKPAEDDKKSLNS